MLIESPNEVSVRQKEIVKEYLVQLDKHINDLRNGSAQGTFEIQDFADLLHIHPTHLSNTINEVLQQSPCDLYENKLVALAQELLRDTSLPIAEIARQLFFDPSNFTKYFKRYAGTTPKQYRNTNRKI
jgi:AraC family transcriptional regulator, regulatory protein of adaptative response / methylphosphotriester-DNA alkyltransferase methyltransferase